MRSGDDYGNVSFLQRRSKAALSADRPSLERIRLAFKLAGDGQENAVFMMPALCGDACHRPA
jgi:hypothetical protein